MLVWIAGGVVLVLAVKKVVSGNDGRVSEEPELPSTANKTVRALWRLYAEMWDLQASTDPLSATMVGDHRFDHKLADLSPSARSKYLSSLRSLSSRLANLPTDHLPTDHELQNYLILKEHLRLELLARDALLPYELPTHHLAGPLLRLADAPHFHPWRSAHDARTFVARLRAFPRQAAQMVAAFGAGVESGKTLPTPAAVALIQQCEEMWTASTEENPMFQRAQPLVEKVGGAVGDLRMAVRDCVIPGFRTLTHFLRYTYLPVTRPTPFHPPSYPATLEFYLATREPKASAIHTIAHDTVQHLSTVLAKHPDPSSLPTHAAGAELLAHFHAALSTAHSRSSALFFRLPPLSSLTLLPVEPFREASAPPAHYAAPATFYANTHRATTRGEYMTPVLALHEGIPGHHLQAALARERRALPRLRRHPTDATLAYTEGWGVYAEFLGEVLGVYESVEGGEVGRMVVARWRACRAVVDSGLNGGGWEVARAVSYLVEDGGMGVGEAEKEVVRCLVFPGEAVAYFWAGREIERLKNEAMRELGRRFSWKGFHGAVLRSGPVPLSILVRNVGAWIEKQKSSTKRLSVSLRQ